MFRWANSSLFRFAEQLTAWQRLSERAARGDREKYLAVEKVPHIESEEFDRI
jgi:hypothetical protein